MSRFNLHILTNPGGALGVVATSEPEAFCTLCLRTLGYALCAVGGLHSSGVAGHAMVA